jgi:hypothetical protein
MVLHVDDTLLIRNNMEIIKEVKSQSSSQFEMKDLGVVDFNMQHRN